MKLLCLKSKKWHSKKKKLTEDCKRTSIDEIIRQNERSNNNLKSQV